MIMDNYLEDAGHLLSKWGVQHVTENVWAFTDVATASRAYIHHSSWPAALCAYSAVDPIFAGGRFPDETLIALCHKVPSMDGAELTALALACGAPTPVFDSQKSPVLFGKALWDIINTYDLGAIFERVSNTHSLGDHYTCRPRGMDWMGSQDPIPEALKPMRKAYKALDPVRQVMALTILHLYLSRPDKYFLLGGCPTKIRAADAIDVLRQHDRALSRWGHLISHYSGW